MLALTPARVSRPRWRKRSRLDVSSSPYTTALLLSAIATLTTPSHAQSPQDPSNTATPRTLQMITTPVNLATALPSSQPLSAQDATIFPLVQSPSSANSTLPSSSTSTSANTRPTPSDSAPRTTPNGSSSSWDNNDDDNTPVNPHAALLNYYFIFLAIFVVFLGVGIWGLHRRKKKMKEAYRSSGRNALARDLAGWRRGGPDSGGNNNGGGGGGRFAGVVGRRWMQRGAPWHNGHGRTVSEEQRMEGLNEHGEAPPPYVKGAMVDEHEVYADEQVPPSTAGSAANILSSPQQQQQQQSGTAEPSIPLRTLSRDERRRPARLSLKPPDYDSAVSTPLEERSPVSPLSPAEMERIRAGPGPVGGGTGSAAFERR